MKEIDFLGKRKIAGLTSIILAVLSLVYMSLHGIDKSVDFEGGTKLTVSFSDHDMPVSTVRDAVNEVERSATIVQVGELDDPGSDFSVKVKKPEVEEGSEAEASADRLRRLEKAFSSMNNEDADLLALLNGIDQDALAEKLAAENVLNLNAEDTVKQQEYAALAQKIKAALSGATDLESLAQAAGGDNADDLNRGLVICFPALNRTTTDLLSAVLKKYDPLGRGANADYTQIAESITSIRADDYNDFLPDYASFMEKVSVGEGEDVAALDSFFRGNFTLGQYKVISNETFSPSIAAELLQNAWGAVLLAMVGILCYIAFRFRWSYAVASVVALAHDVIIALGIFALVGRELSNPVVAAFLTIVGYSLNDTIVVFDRIRDNIGSLKKPIVRDVMNLSINQTLSRTLVTSLTTLFVVAVIFWGSSDIATLADFAFPLLIGVIVGTYSSIFVASPVLLLWNDKIKNITA